MPSRRSLLAAGGTAATTALAGCSFGSRPGTPATLGARDIEPADTAVVARRRGERLDDPHGDLIVEAIAYEPADGDLTVWARASVVPGTNVDDYEGDWLQGGVDVSHDWVAPASDERTAVVRLASDVVPADTPDPVTLETSGQGEVARWQVHLWDDFQESTANYEFRSRYPTADLADGDEIAEIDVEASYKTGGLFGKSSTLSESVTLTYGDREG